MEATEVKTNDVQLEATQNLIRQIFSQQQQKKAAMASTDVKARIARLKKIEDWILAHRDEINAAVFADFKKSAAEVESQEIFLVLSEIRHAIRRLKKWMKPKSTRRILPLVTLKTWIQYEPKGLVLIISPWNFPFLLAAGPLVSALAAGNCVVIKPSEFSPHTSRMVRKMVVDLFPREEVAVICGTRDVATELLKYPFNHIFFTGSSDVGKVIMSAAGKNLASVTLELGGKSPVIVDETADLTEAAKKIIWGRFINGGQTCVAPDYVLVSNKVQAQLLSHLKQELGRFYGEDDRQISNNPDYARIIDNRHYERLKDLIEEALALGAKSASGGLPNNSERYIPPTIMTGVSSAMRIMQEEIFGPILPVMGYDSLAGATKFVNQIPVPLAVYVFSKSKKNIREIFRSTASGSGGINEVVVQFMHPFLPFGGLGQSGFGSSHGFYGFKSFSHEKSFMKGNRWTPIKLLFPPYTNRKRRIIDILVRYF
jgi:aldehyde dehydrogenase (NAD+)